MSGSLFRGKDLDEVVTLARIASELSGRRADHNLSVATLRRWASVGRRGAQLRTWWIGGYRATTRRCVEEFLSQSEPERTRPFTVTESPPEHHQASAFLDEIIPRETRKQSAEVIMNANPDQVERLEVRAEVTEADKLLNSVAKQHGVTNYSLFKSAGYLGLYGMRLKDLRNYKAEFSESPNPQRSLFDFMSTQELTANLRRLLRTIKRIRSTGIRGQKALERMAHKVGREVRGEMVASDITEPEDMPLEADIRTVE